jgi:hypothetical protein
MTEIAKRGAEAWRTVPGSALVVFHLPAAVAVLRFLPQGFPLGHPKFLANTGVPAAGLLLAAAALVLAWRRRPRLLRALPLALAAAWLAAGAGAMCWFPVSLPRAPVGVVVAGALWLLAAMLPRPVRWADAVVAALLGAPLGAGIAFAQRAEAPSTRPSSEAVETIAAGAEDGDFPGFAPGAASLSLPCGTERVLVEPLLSFESRSPDRTWTVLAPPESFGHRRTLRAMRSSPTEAHAWYTDDGESSLALWMRDGGVEVDARSFIPRDVYSHLNGWVAIHFGGAGAKLSLSPVGEEKFDILPSDYPRGRPARMANLHAGGTFRVVEASDGEKGPFRTLAQGHLDGGAPLSLRLHLASGSACTFVFSDWSAQASRSLSPTAGWGMPQNAIQFFHMFGENLVLLTLAETGPGRGWDSVGHAAGTYVNRMRVVP